jgi:putative transcriptional regulator
MAWNRGNRKSVHRAPDQAERASHTRPRAERQTIDVRAARLKLGMTQPAFSACFGVALPTLRKWEQGVRRPEGPARVLIRVIETEPDAVRRALNREAMQTSCHADANDVATDIPRPTPTQRP